jgi:NitT/TauT family transport system substrate-binding protein
MQRFTVAFVFVLSGALAQAAAPEAYRVCWSHYTGWEPWGYAEDSGILKKWATREGIAVEAVRVDDYMDSITQYTAGKFDGCAMTNMDALAIPAAGGVDTTAIIVGDFSNGNDGVVTRDGTRTADIKGHRVLLVSLSVSHYLLTRALATAGLTENDVTLENSDEAEIEAGFRKDEKAVAVTWNPVLQRLKGLAGTRLLFNSAETPGEIIDLMVVRTTAPPSLRRALTGAWYEVMGLMRKKGKARERLMEKLAKSTGATEAEYLAQLETTRMFYDAEEASRFMTSETLRDTMERVRSFSFEHGLYGEGARSKDVVGISFGNVSRLGDPMNVKLRFEPEKRGDSGK